jgi:hypothetical protein
VEGVEGDDELPKESTVATEEELLLLRALFSAGEGVGAWPPPAGQRGVVLASLELASASVSIAETSLNATP